MDLGLSGKRAVVTGSSRGIGLAVARELAAEGADVMLCARGAEALERSREDLASSHPGVRVAAAEADVTDPEQAREVVRRAMSELGGLDVLVANVGTGRGTPGSAAPPEEWQRLIEQNLFSSAFVCQEAAEAMGEGAAMVLIGSIAGLGRLRAPLAYSASKAALVRYGKDMAAALADSGIRVNVVAPGNVLFPGGRWEELLEADREGVESYVASEVPLRRFGTPEEVAAAVTFLASERAGFITGACLTVDGGQLGD